ncbi:hypothetical protein [Microbulbifer elongatus]|uniref:hypothetical protein n=1 Tax=Microbulbifer elongatus TaxID=86173 RepID=UPI001E45A868|nr:hypothetical protein [Microbulbifer elongatus]
MFAKKGFKQDIVIAGKSAGKIVSITPQAEPVYNEIRNLAKQGNYWAQITVNALHQLTSGRLHQDNIFIKPGPVHRGGEEEFVMILPGCKVTVEKQSKDAFKVVYFEADAGYAELQNKDETPGLFHATHLANKGWTAKKSKTGTLKGNEGRLVAIGNSRYSNSTIAAQTAAPYIAASHYSASVGERDLRQNGFDLHYTPSEKRIGGLRNLKGALKPLQAQDIHSSALLLARTMYKARKIANVSWISENGGSAVLTQAMKILADQGVKLSKHNIFLYQPKTSQVETLSVARKLEINVERKFTEVSALNFAGVLGQPAASLNRLVNEKNYKLGHLIGDGATFSGLVATAGGVAATTAGLAGVNIGAIAGSLGVAGAAAVPALGAFLQALSNATPYFKKAKEIGDSAMKATEQFSPRLHNKIKSKF